MKFVSKYRCANGSFCSFAMYLSTIGFSTAFLIFGMAAVVGLFLAALDWIGIAQEAAGADLIATAVGCAALSAVAALLAALCGRRGGYFS